MSTDSTELTFVRCPSCRSLVPAVSTRCRMCGAALEAGAATGQEDATQQSGGRVRQRTMSSKADSEVADSLDQIREENVEELEAAGEAVEDVPFDDPLSAYIEEVDVLDETAAEEAPESEEVNAFESPLEAVEEAAPAEEEISPFAEPEPEVAPAEAALEDTPDLEPAAVAEPQQPAAPVETEAVPQEAVPEQPAPAEPKVRVEHGGRPKSGGLSFSKPAEETTAETPEPVVEAVTEAAPEPEPEQEAAAAVEDLVEELVEEVAEEVVEAAPEPEPEPESEPEPEPVQQAKVELEEVPEFEDEDDEEEEELAPPPPPKKKAKKKKPANTDAVSAAAASAPAVDGRLYGWLISYADNSDGEATELREGRFFVTSSSLKKSDLILEDDSVSTPHAMVTVTVDTGLVIQDLMSERGVFVRRRSSGAYARHPEPTTIENGDWVRFGDVEFLVSLIPYVGDE